MSIGHEEGTIHESVAGYHAQFGPDKKVAINKIKNSIAEFQKTL